MAEDQNRDDQKSMTEEELDETAGSSAPDDLGGSDAGSGLTAGGTGTAGPGASESSTTGRTAGESRAQQHQRACE